MEITLAFTVCLLASPDVCKHIEERVFAEVPAIACMQGGQQQAAAWVGAHPGYRLAENSAISCYLGRPT